MQGRLAHGKELLRYFVVHSYIIVEDQFGQVIVCHRDEMDTIAKPINIPTNMAIPTKLLRHLLACGGFTERQFWDEME